MIASFLFEISKLSKKIEQKISFDAEKFLLRNFLAGSASEVGFLDFERFCFQSSSDIMEIVEEFQYGISNTVKHCYFEDFMIDIRPLSSSIISWIFCNNEMTLQTGEMAIQNKLISLLEFIICECDLNINVGSTKLNAITNNLPLINKLTKNVVVSGDTSARNGKKIKSEDINAAGASTNLDGQRKHKPTCITVKFGSENEQELSVIQVKLCSVVEKIFTNLNNSVLYETSMPQFFTKSALERLAKEYESLRMDIANTNEETTLFKNPTAREKYEALKLKTSTQQLLTCMDKLSLQIGILSTYTSVCLISSFESKENLVRFDLGQMYDFLHHRVVTNTATENINDIENDNSEKSQNEHSDDNIGQFLKKTRAKMEAIDQGTNGRSGDKTRDHTTIKPIQILMFADFGRQTSSRSRFLARLMKGL